MVYWPVIVPHWPLILVRKTREGAATIQDNIIPFTGQVRRDPLLAYTLTAPLTPLIGRKREVMAVCSLLQRPEVRLVSLTGPGGVGKTRVGWAVAGRLLDHFAHGVCFVSLAAVSDPLLVIATIAQALGLWEAGDRPLLEQVRAYLRDLHLLLLLDNFEQVAAAAPQLAHLLAACPQLHVLVTSRAALRIQGEYEFIVSPLVIPDLQQLPANEELAKIATVSLFLQRAQAMQSDFQLTTTNARTIAAICARLEGLPLAIELAAARIKLLPPHALLKRLESRLQVLTGGKQDLPARQQTLLNTLLYQQRERGNIIGFSRRFQKKITKIVDTFWLLAASEDFRYPETQGKRPLGVNLLNRYARRVHQLSTFDPQVTLLLYQVLQAIKSPMALFSPHIVAKVLFKRAPRRSNLAGMSLSGCTKACAETALLPNERSTVTHG